MLKLLIKDPGEGLQKLFFEAFIWPNKKGFAT
jgi:hypothetical protein